MRFLGLLVVLLLIATIPAMVPAAPSLAFGQEDLHIGVTKDCGDGKTFSKLGPKWRSFPVSYYIGAEGEKKGAMNAAFDTYEDQEHPAGPFFAEKTTTGQNIDVTFGAIDGPGNVLARTSYW